MSNIYPAFSGMDAVGGLLISWLVIRAGWGNTKTSLVELADAGIDDEIKDKVRRAATKAIEAMQTADMQDIDVRKVQGIKAGQSYLLELELAVPREWSVARTREVEDAVRIRIGEKVRGARRVRVRFVPKEDVADDFVEEFISPSVSARSSPEPEDEHDHTHTNGHTNGHKHLPNGNSVTKRK
jgi:divalent metal cation (Fe/Co/Zn/Cd) transporter